MLDFFAIWVTHPGNALLWTVLGFLLGALVGHFLALDRDKRKEFNELADPTRSQLRREFGDIRAGVHWTDADTLNLLVDMAHPYKRDRLRRAIGKYQNAHQQHVETGATYGERRYTRTDHVATAITELLAHINRR